MTDVSEGTVLHTSNRGIDLDAGTNLVKGGFTRGDKTHHKQDPRSTWSNSSQNIPPEEQWQAIAVMAYHLARVRGFVGNPVKYWLAAEAKFNAELIAQQSITN